MLLFLSVLLVFAINVLTPGASFVLLVQNSMAHGRRFGYSVAAGLATADTLFAVVAFAGLAAALVGNHLLIKSISFFGGMWLAYGGLHLLLKGTNKQLSNEVDATSGPLSPWLGYRLGMTAGVFNPQAILFFSTMFLATMVSGTTLWEGAALTLGVAGVSVATRCGLVRAMTTATIQAGYLAHKRKIEAISGGALIFFGAKVALPAAVILATSFR